MYHTISKKPTKGADFELYRLNPHNISLMVPLSVDSSDIRFSTYRNGQLLAETVQPVCTIAGQKVNAAFSKEQMLRLPDSFDLIIQKGEEHLAICPVRVSITAGRATCHEAALQIGNETYISLIVSVSGVNGLSAYDIAVQNGYEGTEAEWVAMLQDRVTLEEVISMLSNSGTILYYGVEYEINDPDPQLWSTGIDVWEKPNPIPPKMRGCLLLDNGTVNYYLDPVDWSKKEDGTPSNLDGSDGMVMVEIPEHYRGIDINSSSEETFHHIQVSEYPLLGFQKIEKFYYAAYESAYDNQENKLASVVNYTARYRGGTNTDDSFLGRPATGLDLPTARQAVRNRGAGWELLSIRELDAVRFMYLVEYANRNSQSALGSGVYIAEDLVDYPGPAAPCGATNSLGNGSGKVVIGQAFDNELEANVDVEAIRYRGIENIWGNTCEMLDGVMSDYTEGVRSGIFVAKSPDYYADYTPDEEMKWEKVPNSYPIVLMSYGTITRMGVDSGYLLPHLGEMGMAANTFWADYVFPDSFEPVITTHPLLHGGGMGGFSRNGIGLFFTMANTENIFPLLSAYIGSRIIYRPQP